MAVLTHSKVQVLWLLLSYGFYVSSSKGSHIEGLILEVEMLELTGTCRRKRLIANG